MTVMAPRTLLSIIELGGYPNFTPLYAEFNFQSDFRDRASGLESLPAAVQRMPRTKVIVFYENEQAHQLAKLMARFPVHEALAYPIDVRKLEESLRRIPR